MDVDQPQQWNGRGHFFGAAAEANGIRLAVGGMRVQVWNVTAEPVRESDWPHPTNVYALTFSRSGTRLVTTCGDGFARVFAVGESATNPPPAARSEQLLLFGTQPPFSSTRLFLPPDSAVSV